jgi:mannose-6-phosphate isomerase-like protein (cupin superfamily)
MPTIPMLENLSAALAKLPLPAIDKWKHGVFDVEIMRHGSMSVIVYAPQVEDLQTFHTQDELYIVHSGESEFVRGDEQFKVKTGDVFFVAANVHHRFINFSESFTVWALFWGPNGGEKEAT